MVKLYKRILHSYGRRQQSCIVDECINLFYANSFFALSQVTEFLNGRTFLNQRHFIYMRTTSSALSRLCVLRMLHKRNKMLLNVRSRYARKKLGINFHVRNHLHSCVIYLTFIFNPMYRKQQFPERGLNSNCAQSAPN